MHNMKTTTRGTYILVSEYKYNLNILIRNMVGYEFSSIIVEKSTRNQVNGYELTSSLWLRVDFPGTG